jgi:purine-binding chemotaxis protein CheW
MSEGDAFEALVVRAGAVSCVIPLENVVETMRALPCTRLPSAPLYVRGASVIRGVATAVVDLAVLLDEASPERANRFVLLRGASDPVALAVDEVVDVRRLARDLVGPMPRLLRDLGARHLESLGALDGSLVPILAAIALPEELGHSLRSAEGPT